MPHDPSNERRYPPPAPITTSRGSQPVAYSGRQVAAPNSGIESTISHTFFLWVLRQWWAIVIPAGLVLAAIAAALVFLFYVPKYESTALLMIENAAPYIAFSSQDQGGQSERYVQTQLELLRSAVVLEPVLGRPEIAAMKDLDGVPDRVKYLREHLTIKQVGRSELYNITYASPSAQNAANLVNAVAAEYLSLHAGDEFDRSQRVIDILEEERRRRGLEVERLRTRVVELAKDVTGRDPFGGNKVTDAKLALSPVGAIFQSLTDTEVDQEVRRAELQSLVDSPAVRPEQMEVSGVLDLEVENSEAVRTRQQAIKQTEAMMEAIKTRAMRFQKDPQWATDPNYVGLKGQLEQQTKDLTEAKAKAREVIIAEKQAKQSEEKAEHITKMKRELASLNARRELLAKRFSDQVKDLQSGGAKSVEFEFARGELEREEKVFELIASRKLALQTELRAPARVQLRQKANLATVPLVPIPYKLLLLACSAAFVAPFGLAVVREITVRRISDIEQLAQETSLRVLGEVAALPVRYIAVSPNQLSGRIRRDTYVYAESINSLRTNLALANGHDRHVYAVTSAASGEGKTSVAVSLAMSISNATKEPTLIIDGDMRRPFVANMLKAKNQPGLFEVLAKKANVDDAIQSVGENNLHVIPAGRATKSTHSVVDIADVKQLLEQLGKRFATIIIDTPPILGASESLVLAKVADSVLFCSLSNVSKASQVRLAIDRLEHAQVNLAGAVLSGKSAKQYEYVYGYYADRIETES
jgi:capsular exopolysaccharide synthesis family protein